MKSGKVAARAGARNPEPTRAPCVRREAGHMCRVSERRARERCGDDLDDIRAGGRQGGPPQRADPVVSAGRFRRDAQGWGADRGGARPDGPLVKPGVTTASLDKFVFEFARDHDAYPAPLNYRGYRKSVCISINHVVCHGIPDENRCATATSSNRRDPDRRRLAWRREPHVRRGRGLAAGAAPDRRHLRSDDARHRGDQARRDDGDIGYAIQTYAEAERCSVVRDFRGHGLGRLFHDEPNILHVGAKAKAFRSTPACSSPSSR